MRIVGQLASATLLTELPSLLVMVIGALVWLDGLPKLPATNWRTIAKMIRWESLSELRLRAVNIIWQLYPR
jgi:hypothetical protein